MNFIGDERFPSRLLFGKFKGSLPQEARELDGDTLFRESIIGVRSLISTFSRILDSDCRDR